MTSSDAHTYFEHPDWTGTTRVRTDYAGNVAGSMSTLPFGDGTSLGINNANAEAETAHYAMQDKDFYGSSDSGTNHALFRQYMDTVGSWMSPDPYLGSYDPSNPQSMNRYSYVLNNPLAYVDPDGTSGCQDGDPTCDPDCEVAECSVMYPNGIPGSDGAPSPYTAYRDAQGNLLELLGYDGIGYGVFEYIPINVLNFFTETDMPWVITMDPTQWDISAFSTGYGQVAPQMGGGGGSVAGAPNSARQNRGFWSCTFTGRVGMSYLSTTLDAVGIIPGEGNVLHGIQFGAGIAAAGLSVFGSPTDAGLSATGLGLELADRSGASIAVHGIEMIPIVGNVVSAGATLHDVFGSEGLIANYEGCMAGTNP